MSTHVRSSIFHFFQEGKPFYCKVMINKAVGLPQNIDKSFCKYKFYLDDKYIETSEMAGTINPVFTHEKTISFKTATKQVWLMFKNFEHFSFLFSNKILVIRAEKHIKLVRIANRKDTDQAASSEAV